MQLNYKGKQKIRILIIFHLRYSNFYRTRIYIQIKIHNFFFKIFKFRNINQEGIMLRLYFVVYELYHCILARSNSWAERTTAALHICMRREADLCESYAKFRNPSKSLYLSNSGVTKNSKRDFSWLLIDF